MTDAVYLIKFIRFGVDPYSSWNFLTDVNPHVENRVLLPVIDTRGQARS